MTKLKLNLAQGAGEILTREELKKVLGGTTGSEGSGSGVVNSHTCSCTNSTGATVSCTSPNPCTVQHDSASGHCTSVTCDGETSYP